MNGSRYVFEVDGIYKKNGAEHGVKIVVGRDDYGSTTLYMVDGKYRYDLNISEKTVSLSSPVFIPVVTRYTAVDGSYFALSENNEDATEYTASFIINSIVDGNGAQIRKGMSTWSS